MSDIRRDGPNESPAAVDEEIGEHTYRDLGREPRRHDAVPRHVVVHLPRDLAALYRPIRSLDAGAEADVALVEGREDGGQYVLKIYRRADLNLNEVMLTRVQDLNEQHVVKILRYGRNEELGRWWEVQAYLPAGSLRSLLSREKLDEARVRRVVEELTEAIDHVQQAAGIVHRDIKPENILIRDLDSLDLVLGDFGLAIVTEGSEQFLSESGTAAYLAPEAHQGVAGPARDWYALGLIVVEILTGRHPFRKPDGALYSANHMAFLAWQGRIDLSGLPDDRWRNVARGLLCPHSEARWGADQVRRWLRGENPDVPQAGRVTMHAAPGVLLPFNGHEVEDRGAMAEILAADWSLARRALNGRPSRSDLFVELEAWLEANGVRFEPPPAMRGSDLEVAELIVALDTSAPPVFRGYVVDVEGLQAIAARLIELSDSHRREDDQERGQLVEVVRELYRQPVLQSFARLDGQGGLAYVDQRWRASCEQFDNAARSHQGRLHGLEREAQVMAPLLIASLTDRGQAALQTQARRAARDRRARRVQWFAEHADRWRRDRDEGLDLLTVVLMSAATGEVDAMESVNEARRRERDERARAEGAAARQRRAVARIRFERLLTGVGVLALVSGVVPYRLGLALAPTWFSYLHSTVYDWYTVSFIVGWQSYVPPGILGGALILGAIGLVRALPVWRARGRRAIAGVVIVLVALVLMGSLPRVEQALVRRAHKKVDAQAFPMRWMNDVCAGPVVGNRHDGVWTWYATAAEGRCSTFVARRGWRVKWERLLPGHLRVHGFALYGGVLVTHIHNEQGPNFLIGRKDWAGEQIWVARCPDRSSNSAAGVVYHGVGKQTGHAPIGGKTEYIEVYCDRGVKILDPATGHWLR